MSAPFPPLGPEFDQFLYAVVGEEPNGMQLTVASAIARSGADPWQEAARISKMPRDAAVRILARFIPETSDHDTNPATDLLTVDRLFALLPARGNMVAPLAKSGAPAEFIYYILAAVLFAGIVLAPAFTSKPSGEAGAPGGAPVPPPSTDSVR